MRFLSAFLLFALLPLGTLLAQDAPVEETTDPTWKFTGGIGFDLSGLGIINPRVGGGTGRFAVGGLGTFSANRKSDKSFWNNQITLQLAAQRQGRTSPSQPSGFQKNMDILRLASTYGYKIAGDKWYASADLLAQSQLLQTYRSNFLKPVELDGNPDIVVSRFLAPALVQFSPGITYKPNAHLTFQYSPVAIRFIYVADDSLALLNIHGNVVNRDANGNVTDYQNYFLGLGSELVTRYENKFFDERVSMTSALRLFSNYLKDPQNVDVLFTNNFSVQIFKGLSLDLLGELFYDDDMKMNIDANKNRIYGDEGDRQAPAAQLTGAFMLKYSKIF